MMYLNDYQHEAVNFAEFTDPFYPMASLVVEASELIDLFVKPRLRGDTDAQPSHYDVVAEAGDVLWNLAVLLKQEGITLSEVAEYNIAKLTDRKNRGVIKGSGGNR